MALILSIETSTKICSVALHRDGELLAMQELYTERSHSGMLIILIRDVIAQAHYTLNDLDAVAVSAGPGSYTGLRIGTSTAKGIAFGLNIPLLAVNTLEAMAYGMKNYYASDTLLCPMIDARRMEVYCLLADTQMSAMQETQAKIIDEESFLDLNSGQEIVFFGDGALKCKPVLSEALNAVFVEGITPSAKNIGSIAFEKFSKGKVEDLAYYDPFYLKEFRATQPKKK